MASTTPKKQKNNYMLYGGIGLVAIAGIAALSSTSKPKKLGEDTFNDENAGQNNTGNAGSTSYTPPIANNLNRNLVLRIGSKGEEVKQLQRQMKITADGIFGPQTEATLYSLKKVKQVSLNQYATLETVNTNNYAIGSKVMSNNKSGTKLYGNKTLADGSNMSTGEVFTTIDFGEPVGVVKGANSAITWYRIEFDAWSGKTFMWVRATDVKKY